MRRHATTVLAAIGAATVLVLAANTVAISATGQGFLLGKSNSAGAVTSLTRTTDGPALKLTTKSSASAPLVVNGKGKVLNLHADRLDGFEGASLQTRPVVLTASVPNGSFNFSLPLNLATGSHLVSYSVRFSGPTDAEAQCSITFGDGYTGLEGVRLAGVGNFAGVSGSGLVPANADNRGFLQCQSVEAFTVETNGIRVVATKVDGVTTRPAVVLPIP